MCGSQRYQGAGSYIIYSNACHTCLPACLPVFHTVLAKVRPMHTYTNTTRYTCHAHALPSMLQAEWPVPGKQCKQKRNSTHTSQLALFKARHPSPQSTIGAIIKLAHCITRGCVRIRWACLMQVHVHQSQPCSLAGHTSTREGVLHGTARQGMALARSQLTSQPCCLPAKRTSPRPLNARLIM